MVNPHPRFVGHMFSQRETVGGTTPFLTTTGNETLDGISVPGLAAQFLPGGPLVQPWADTRINGGAALVPSVRKGSGPAGRTDRAAFCGPGHLTATPTRCVPASALS